MRVFHAMLRAQNKNTWTRIRARAATLVVIILWSYVDRPEWKPDYDDAGIIINYNIIVCDEYGARPPGTIHLYILLGASPRTNVSLAVLYNIQRVRITCYIHLSRRHGIISVLFFCAWRFRWKTFVHWFIIRVCTKRIIFTLSGIIHNIFNTQALVYIIHYIRWYI